MSGRGKSARSLELIEACHKILSEIQPCSVRAVCYALFNRHLITSMAKTETNRVSRLLTAAREEDLIRWDWIVDETRSEEALPTWDEPEDYAHAVTHGYRRNKWLVQRDRVVVWSEKGTVRGTVKPVLDRYEVPFTVMHGHTSATVVHDIAKTEDARPLVALYIGDFDPSGMHMSDIDLPRRLVRYGADRIRVRRIGLVKKDLRLASVRASIFSVNTKTSDSRWRWFRATHGDQCAELDALPPPILRQRLETEIRGHIDFDSWDRYVTAEAVERESIVAAVSRWRRFDALAAVGER